MCGSSVVVGFFEWLGDEYFSWWYVQHILPYVFMHLYSICNLRLFLSILNFFNIKSGIQTPDRNDKWYQHLLTLIAFFFLARAIPKGLTSGLR